MEKWNRYAGKVYLSLCVADEFPEQEPAHIAARWYDLFFLVIPICGFLMFVIATEERFRLLYKGRK